MTDVGSAIFNFLVKRRAKQRGITIEEAEREIIREMKKEGVG